MTSWGLVMAAMLLLAGAVALALSIKRGRRPATPAALANRILRYPERILLEVPGAMARRNTGEQAGFLLQAEAELAGLGGLETRRELLARFADFFQTPSPATLEALNAFVSRGELGEFRQVLSWRGNCQAALGFLSLAGGLATSLEGQRPLKPLHRRYVQQIRRDHDQAMRGLRGDYREIAGQWYRLFQGLHTVVEPQPQRPKRRRKKKKPKGARKKGAATTRKRLTRETKPPNALTDEEKSPDLLEFQRVARELFIAYRDWRFSDRKAGATAAKKAGEDGLGREALP